MIHLPYDQLTHDQIIFALGEEIGDPELFVGRKKEMALLMKWAAGTKRRISGSMGILARRKKGKTALLQRFFNLLYTRNDPQLIPFYYRVLETRFTRLGFAEYFYRSLLSQYFAFTTRKPELVAKVLPLSVLEELATREDPHVASDIQEMRDTLENSPELAWPHAQNAGHRISQFHDVRILQILDEFQYLNKWIISDHDSQVELLCHSYMGAAESKFSPQIVAGSYIGWLAAIFRHMTARYREWHLEGLRAEEALAAVYAHAYAHQVPITNETAPYIAEVCENDPFYIAATIRNFSEEKDLTTRAGVRDALTFETIGGQGEIAAVWGEYLADAIARVNDQNAHKMVLYLASYDPEERTRKQIKEDLKIEISDPELDKRLKQLVKADILAQGSSNFRFRGLGDPIFAMVFRRIYGEEIEQISVASIDEDFKQQLASAKGLASLHKGRAAEFKVRYQLLVASLRGATLSDICVDPLSEGLGELPLGPFQSIRKARFYVDQERSFEADLHAIFDRATSTGEEAGEEGFDLILEVKAWEKRVPREAVLLFIEMKEALADEPSAGHPSAGHPSAGHPSAGHPSAGHPSAGHPERRTVFLFYSESELGEELSALLREAGIALVDAAELASYEALPEHL